MVKLLAILSRTCSWALPLSILSVVSFYWEIPFSNCVLDYMKNSNGCFGIKREYNWAGLDLLDFLFLLSLIMFPGGPQEEMFKEEVRKEKQVRKWNICLRCWLRHSWAKDLKCSLYSNKPAKYVELALIWVPVFSSSVDFTPVTKVVMCRGKEEGKKARKEEYNSKAPFPLSSALIFLPNLKMVENWTTGFLMEVELTWSDWLLQHHYSWAIPDKPFIPQDLDLGERTSLISAVRIFCMSGVFQLWW